MNWFQGEVLMIAAPLLVTGVWRIVFILADINKNLQHVRNVNN